MRTADEVVGGERGLPVGPVSEGGLHVGEVLRRRGTMEESRMHGGLLRTRGQPAVVLLKRDLR